MKENEIEELFLDKILDEYRGESITTLLEELADKDVQIAKLLDWSYKALKHLPQAYWDSLKEITDEHKVK